MSETEPRRCQGCGAIEGEGQKVSGRRHSWTIPCKLQRMELLDYGPRLMCELCYEAMSAKQHALRAKGRIIAR